MNLNDLAMVISLVGSKTHLSKLLNTAFLEWTGIPPIKLPIATANFPSILEIFGLASNWKSRHAFSFCSGVLHVCESPVNENENECDFEFSYVDSIIFECESGLKDVILTQI